MELGFIAPPVGLNLLLSSYRFNKPILEVMRAVIPMLIVLFIGVTYAAHVYQVTPSETETVISQLAHANFGAGPLYALTIIAAIWINWRWG